MKDRLLSVVFSTLCMLILAGCNLPAGAGAGPRTWIDAPLDGMTLPLGSVVVRSHAASDGGTAQAALLVNGTQVRLDSAPDGASPLVEFTQAWTPPGPGIYVLQVISSDHAGNDGHSNEVQVQVGELGVAADTPTPINGTPGTPTVTPTITATTSSGPSIIFTVPANCREGPGTNYLVATAFQAGTQLPIEGRNVDSSWLWVLIPGGGHCWVSAGTGNPLGPFSLAPLVDAPPPPAVVEEPTEEEPGGGQQPPSPSKPAAPGGFGIQDVECSSQTYRVELSWQDVDNEQGYRIYRNNALIASLGPNAKSYQDTAGDYESHPYRVEAWNAGGASSSSTQNSTGCLF